MPNSLYRMPVVYVFLACVFCYLVFLFLSLRRFCLCLLSLELGRCSSDLFLSSRPRTGLATTYRTVVFVCVCSHWSLVDVPLISFCPADHVPDWQPRIVLGMVEARSVNVKKTTTTSMLCDRVTSACVFFSPSASSISEAIILL